MALSARLSGYDDARRARGVPPPPVGLTHM